METNVPLLRSPIGLIGLAPMIAFDTWLIATGRLKVTIEPVVEDKVAVEH